MKLPRRFSRAAPRVLALLGLLLFYAITVVITIRSGLFNFSRRPLSSQETTAYWAAIVATLGVTTAGVTAYVANLQSRRSERRLNLDSVTASLGLIVDDSRKAYSAGATIAGAVATLVHLGQPRVAVRTLSVLWTDGAIDRETFTWTINEILTTETDDGTRGEALRLLRNNAESLIGDREGDLSWPRLFTYP